MWSTQSSRRVCTDSCQQMSFWCLRLLVLCVTVSTDLILHIDYTTNTNEPVKRMCEEVTCKPGTEPVICDVENSTARCQKCRNGTFNDIPSNSREISKGSRCKDHQNCSGKLRTDVPGTLTTNNICKCNSDNGYSAPDNRYCVYYNVCAAGYELKHDSATGCTPCADGYFKSNIGYHLCTKCTICNGTEVANCTSLTDRECEGAAEAPSSDTSKMTKTDVTTEDAVVDSVLKSTVEPAKKPELPVVAIVGIVIAAIFVAAIVGSVACAVDQLRRRRKGRRSLSEEGDIENSNKNNKDERRRTRGSNDSEMSNNEELKPLNRRSVENGTVREIAPLSDRTAEADSSLTHTSSAGATNKSTPLTADSDNRNGDQVTPTDSSNGSSTSNQVLRNAFEKLKSKVEESVNVSSIFDYLRDKDVISKTDYHQLCHCVDHVARSKRCSLLMSMISSNDHPDAYVTLRQALENYDAYEWLVKEIDKHCN